MYKKRSELLTWAFSSGDKKNKTNVVNIFKMFLVLKINWYNFQITSIKKVINAENWNCKKKPKKTRKGGGGSIKISPLQTKKVVTKMKHVVEDSLILM